MTLKHHTRSLRNSIYCACLALLVTTGNALGDPRETGERGIAEYATGNVIEAIELLRSSAEQGYAPAQARLGLILDQADENDEAASWYRRAAEQANAEGQYGLGTLYASGEGVEKDPQEALNWIRRAAEQAYAPAMRALAFAIENGELGLEANTAESLSWYQRAADSGDHVAVRRLADAYRNGELGLPADAQKAQEYQAIVEGK